MLIKKQCDHGQKIFLFQFGHNLLDEFITMPYERYSDWHTLPTLLHTSLTNRTTLDSLMATTATSLTVVCYPIRYVTRRIRLFIMCYVNWCVFVSDFYVCEAAMPSVIYYHQASGGGRPYDLTPYSFCAMIIWVEDYQSLPIATASLPFLTKTYARHARPIGVLGLVYQSLPQ